MEPIKHIIIKEDMKVSELVSAMGEIGFGARNIGEASEILDNMIKSECKVFLGLAGAMVPGGMKQIIIDMLKNNYIDVLVSTGANLTHDLIEALGESHYKGDVKIEDSVLHEKGIDRIHNVFMKNEVYETLEDFFREHYAVFKNIKSIKEFLWKIGSLIENPDSILKVCYEKQIPLFCPGIQDSGIGLMMWGRQVEEKENSEMRVFEDLNEIIDLAWDSEKIGVFYIGGGVPKNYIQQALQFSKGADYGIQITTDRVESGGSSGAPLKEGISWGKMNPSAQFVNVYCDATIALPLIMGSIK